MMPRLRKAPIRADLLKLYKRSKVSEVSSHNRQKKYERKIFEKKNLPPGVAREGWAKVRGAGDFKRKAR